MWKKINHLTKPKHNNAIHTIDIPVDSSVGWNDIKKTQKSAIQNNRRSSTH